MDYELAEQLKHAGFPQRLNRDDRENQILTDNELVHYPDLSELIEACGEPFAFLKKTLSNEWISVSYGFKSSAPCSTPDEAVAKLYLALNPPKQSQTISD